MDTPPPIIELIGAPGSGKTTLVQQLARSSTLHPRPESASIAKVRRLAGEIRGKSRLAAFGYTTACAIPPLRYILAEQLTPSSAWRALADRNEDLIPVIEHAHHELGHLRGDAPQIARRIHLLYRACLDVALIQTHQDKTPTAPILCDESITQASIALALHHPHPKDYLDRYLAIRNQAPSAPLRIIYCQIDTNLATQRIHQRNQPLYDHISKISGYIDLAEHSTASARYFTSTTTTPWDDIAERLRQLIR